MSLESLRHLIADLGTSASALAVLGAELQARTFGTSIHPALRPHVDRVLEEIGAAAALEGISPAELQPLVAEIRHFWLLDGELLAGPDRAPGWTYRDPQILQTGGELTEGVARALARIVPQLDGLAPRLNGTDGRFLDVGTGVARLSIAVARQWPAVRVVGIDTWAPSLALAQRNVEAAGLQDRIDLREQAGEALTDETAFDLAWIPAPFIPPDALPRVVERVHQALKPGGWVFFATTRPGSDLRSALLRLRVAAFGGRPTTQEDVETLLTGVGFANVQVLPGPPRDFKMLVAARRAPIEGGTR